MYQWFIGVSLLVNCCDLCMVNVWFQVVGNGFQNIVFKIIQVWGKNYFCFEVVGNFWLMMMVKYVVWLQVDFIEVVVDCGFVFCVVYFVGGVDYWLLVEIQQIGIDQWFQ